jgi:3-deoxy-D-manno-octulosonate 8-phosphate phosphatase KdsC-like HAD superfamily phosphatase
VAYIGDDVNDYDIMTLVGHTACPADAMDPIKKISSVVLERKGGEACVREYIDRFLLQH